jgi:transcriptional regulator with XRE-family HTH domain
MARKAVRIEVEKHSTVKKHDSPFSQKLSEMIKAKKSNTSKAQILVDLGISARTLELWEAQQSRPDIDMLPILAKYFGVTVDYLVGRTDNAAGTIDDLAASERYGFKKTALEVLQRKKGSDTINIGGEIANRRKSAVLQYRRIINLSDGRDALRKLDLYYHGEFDSNTQSRGVVLGALLADDKAAGYEGEHFTINELRLLGLHSAQKHLINLHDALNAQKKQIKNDGEG